MSADNTGFNPLTTARAVIEQTDLVDPDDIAAEVFRRTPKGDIDQLYRGLLRDVARSAIHKASMQVTAEHRDQPRRSPNRSSKVAAIRAAHYSYYDQRVYASGEWKLLRNCTRDDVLDLAAQRQQAADQNAAKAEEFRALHAKMVTAGVTLAGELDEQTQEAAA